MLRIEANGRALPEAINQVAGASGITDIDGLPEPRRSKLASALGATSGLLDIANDVDRQYVLEAMVTDDQAVVSIKRGARVAQPGHGSPSIFEAKR